MRLSAHLCVFLRCLIRTARRQRRLRSAAGGWRWTWGSLHCGATPSPFAAPPAPHHHRAHRAPAPMSAPWEVKLHNTDEKLQLFTFTLFTLIQAFHSGCYYLYTKGYHFQSSSVCSNVMQKFLELLSCSNFSFIIIKYLEY